MKQFITFIAGAALGSLATWIIIKKKYEQIAQEEINSVKEVYSKKKPKIEDTPDNTDDPASPEEIKQYHETIESAGYSDYSGIYQSKSEVEPDVSERPYLLSEEEFGELDNYEAISLTHYADGILADDDDQIIPDDEIDEVVGADYAEHFGEYDDNTVWIRNDKLKCDYEICLDPRKYSEVHNITYHGGFPS